MPGSGPAATSDLPGSRESAHLPPVGGGDPAHRIARIMDCGQDFRHLTGLPGTFLPGLGSASRPAGQRPAWVGVGEAAGPQREVTGRSRDRGRLLLVAGGDLIEGVGDAQPAGARPADGVRGRTQGDPWLSRDALPAGEGAEQGLAVVAGERAGGGGLPQ